MEAHKAYVFDDKCFFSELYPKMLRALDTNFVDTIRQFINLDSASFRSPYTGEPLQYDWESELENNDVQEFLDFALTKYYNPIEDIGIGNNWTTISDLLSDELKPVLLGNTISSTSREFNPGRIGSYFQSESQVQSNFKKLAEYCNMNERVRPTLSKVLRMLKTSSGEKRGLYVTF